MECKTDEIMDVNKIYQGDVLKVLKTLPDNSIRCCVTSPPYWGLRDYGMDGQIGLEETPEKFVEIIVEVFREVKRILTEDGTLWLNLGDSYSAAPKNRSKEHHDVKSTLEGRKNGGCLQQINKITDGLKPKDLVGIPWEVAKALRNPYYNGKIKNELDRVWLAAMIDGEGSICGSYHIRKDDHSPRTNITISITNTNEDVLKKAFLIYPDASKHLHEKHYNGHLGKRDSWRWHVFNINNKQNIICEIYPYLIAKKKQAILAYNFFEYQKLAKHYGKTPQKNEIRDLRKWITDNLSILNKGGNIDIPNWMKEPHSLYEDGFYLRQDIIWSKPNPMPESVTDRCTKSHEYIFLLSKSKKYYYDGESIKTEIKNPYEGIKYAWGRAIDGSVSDNRKGEGLNIQRQKSRPFGVVIDRLLDYNSKEKILRPNTKRGEFEKESLLPKPCDKANKRSVWEVCTESFSEAHFATFPQKLIVDCIKAGSTENDIILDPFFGAGTTGLVARKLNRNYIGIELNPKYIKIAEQRLYNELGMFL